MNAIPTLWKAMYAVCSLDNVYFRMLVQESKHLETLAASLDFVLGDLSYIIRRGLYHENSNHNNLASADMVVRPKIRGARLGPEVPVYVFCSALHSGLWYSVVSNGVGKQEGSGQPDYVSDREEKER